MTMSMGGRCGADFRQVVRAKCYAALQEVGFTRYRKEGVDWPMENGFHCWVGLNTALEHDYVEINPLVGVHAVTIEMLWTRLKAGRYPGRYDRGIASFARHMGELAPREHTFRFTKDTDIAAEADRLARLYVDVGLPYALSIGTYRQLLPLVLERAPMLGAYPERVASCLYLMDRKEDAREFVNEFLQDHRDYFEGFAVPFIEILND